MEYKTKDMNLAAIMLYFGATLVEVFKDPAKDKRALYFLFTGNIDFAGIEKDYWNQELTVEPKKLFWVLKEIKNRLYQK